MVAAFMVPADDRYVRNLCFELEFAVREYCVSELRRTALQRAIRRYVRDPKGARVALARLDHACDRWRAYLDRAPFFIDMGGE